MQNVRFIRDEHLEKLRADIMANMHKYENSGAWIEGYFDDSSWFLESDILIPSFELTMPSNGKLFDLENTEKVYSAFQNLPLAYAADERLWVYLTHTSCWEYMLKRWNPKSKNNKKQFINERYFFATNTSRAIVRNGLARLWWYGYLTYDDKRDDPYELTKHMLSKLDIAQSLLERSVSHVPAVMNGVLEVLDEKAKCNEPFDQRQKFRDLMMYINHIGGVKVLDMLNKDDLKEIVRNKIKDIISADTKL